MFHRRRYRGFHLDTSSADWPSGWLHPPIHGGSRGASHTLAPPPSPCSHRLHSGAALPDALEPVLAGRLRRHAARRCILPPATSLPLYLVGFTIQHPLAASLDRPILLAIQTRRVKIPASQHRTRIPRSPQQSPPGLTDNRQVLTLTTVQTSVRESHQRGGSRPNQPRVQRNAYIIQSFLAAQGRNRHHID